MGTKGQQTDTPLSGRPSASGTKPTTIAELCAWVHGAAVTNTLIQGSLGKAAPHAPAKRVVFRPVTVKEGERIAVIFSEARRDLTKIIDRDRLPALLEENLSGNFGSLSVKTTQRDLHAEISRAGKLQVGFSKPTQTTAPSTSHNREKHYQLSPALGWMRALGISNERGEIRHEMRDKFIQIERFVNILKPEITQLIDSAPLSESLTLEAIDIGSGKSYLTFALHELLSSLVRHTPATASQPAFASSTPEIAAPHLSTLRFSGPHFSVQGIERRADLVALCSRIVRECNLSGLSFVETLADQATFSSHTNKAIRMIVALHACDTATDDALATGIRAGAQLICVAPCCQKYVRKKMHPHGLLETFARHGIHAERLSEMLTDTLRALYLEVHGYRTKVVEFIDKSHTAKNTMILASRAPDNATTQTRSSEAQREINALCREAGLKDFYLDTLQVR